MGEGDEGWEHEGKGWLNWGKDGEREQWNRYLDGRSRCGVKEKPGAREIPRNPQKWPQIRCLAILERVPEELISCNGIGAYLNCHHRTFAQWLMCFIIKSFLYSLYFLVSLNSGSAPELSYKHHPSSLGLTAK